MPSTSIVMFGVFPIAGLLGITSGARRPPPLAQPDAGGRGQAHGTGGTWPALAFCTIASYVRCRALSRSSSSAKAVTDQQQLVGGAAFIRRMKPGRLADSAPLSEQLLTRFLVRALIPRGSATVSDVTGTTASSGIQPFDTNFVRTCAGPALTDHRKRAAGPSHPITNTRLRRIQ
jgi:hypothetical protein